MGSENLHCYEIGPDTVVALSEDDAWAVWCEHTGESREDYENEGASLVPDDSLRTIWCDEHDVAEPYSDGSRKVTRTAGEWAAHNGRGFLSSTEY